MVLSTFFIWNPRFSYSKIGLDAGCSPRVQSGWAAAPAPSLGQCEAIARPLVKLIGRELYNARLAVPVFSYADLL